jgi:hypothetical protein
VLYLSFGPPLKERAFLVEVTERVSDVVIDEVLTDGFPLLEYPDESEVHF